MLIGVKVVPTIAATERYDFTGAGKWSSRKGCSVAKQIADIILRLIVPAAKNAGVPLILKNDIFPRNHRTGDAASRMWLIGQVAAIQRPESAVTFC